MAVYTKTDKVTVAVGIVNQTVIAPFNAQGEWQVLLVVENLSATETFTGYAWSSPDGTNQWVIETNDEFVAIPPVTTRRMLLPVDRLWVRALGNFIAAPANVRISVLYLPPIPFR